MAFFEQLLYGHSHLADEAGRQELAHSAGMGAGVASEIHAICEAWGPAPDLGLQHPALISYPLQGTMPSMRGRLYAVICVAPVEPLLFHAVILTDASFHSFGRNPFALARAVEFISVWNGGVGLDRLEVDVEAPASLVDPAPGPEDVGLVDEGVLQFILSGVLQLPVEQACRPSDRALALMIASLPAKDRKDLKFASFTTSQVNAYDIAGVASEGATFAGWQRLMMSRIDSGVTSEQAEYKNLIAGYLKQSDLVGLERVSNRHNFLPQKKSNIVVAAKKVSGPQGSVPLAEPSAPPTASSAFGPTATLAGNSSGARSPVNNGAPIRPAAAAGAGRSSRTPLSEHGLNPAAHQAKPKRPARNRSRVSVPFSRGKRGAGSKLLRTVSVVLLVFVAGWVGTMWRDGQTLSESLEWAGLPGMDGGREDVHDTGSLLEVVDVGRVYHESLKHTGGSGFGLNASADRARHKALGRLQADAVEPLLAQVMSFVTTTDDGIRKSGRQDREVERLAILAKHGVVLEKEMDRLELAWYSFTTSANWCDLGSLSDVEIMARRDSLESTEKGAMSDVRLGMGTEKIWQQLKTSRRRMDGMATVVKLFQSKKWSERWQKRLARAAEKVSPSAGRTTRAYRNSAFALIRLKKAEREEANSRLPFAGSYQAEQWPSPKVRALLPLLRKEVGRFSDKSAPALLGATLSLYAALEQPNTTIGNILDSAQQWQRLQNNAAVHFDEDLYGAFLERLRYEAAGRALVFGDSTASIPAHLYEGAASRSVMAFADSLNVLTRAEQWQAMSATADEPFLKRWAGFLAADTQARLAKMEEEFAREWAECRGMAVALQGQAALGEDWSAAWAPLRDAAVGAGDRYAAVLAELPEQTGRFEYLTQLVQAMTVPRPLHMERVTVRLDQDVLSGPTEVQLELRTPVRGGIWTSEPFMVGPASPVGTGWVGTAFLAWTVPLAPEHQMSGRIVQANRPGVLLEVAYPSLAEGAGPTALSRPRSGDWGSLSFRVDAAGYWRDLKIPDMGLVF